MSFFSKLFGRGDARTYSPENIAEWLYAFHMDFCRREGVVSEVIRGSARRNRDEDAREAPIAFALALYCAELALTFRFVYGDLDLSELFADAPATSSPKLLVVAERLHTRMKVLGEPLLVIPEDRDPAWYPEAMASSFTIPSFERIRNEFVPYYAITMHGLAALNESGSPDQPSAPHANWADAVAFASNLVTDEWAYRELGEMSMVALHQGIRYCLHPDVRSGAMTPWDEQSGLQETMGAVGKPWVSHLTDLNQSVIGFLRGKRPVF